MITDDVDLNSGITLVRASPALPEQINNVSFVVFNHTNESINFPNQGYGITVFGYNEVSNQWQKLPLAAVPFPDPKTLPPKLEVWDFQINNSWDILQSDATALGYPEFRVYVSGTGAITRRVYGAYLDVRIYSPP
jgi:hypothetical protein